MEWFCTTENVPIIPPLKDLYLPLIFLFLIGGWIQACQYYNDFIERIYSLQRSTAIPNQNKGIKHAPSLYSRETLLEYINMAWRICCYASFTLMAAGIVLYFRNESSIPTRHFLYMPFAIVTGVAFLLTCSIGDKTKHLTLHLTEIIPGPAYAQAYYLIHACQQEIQDFIEERALLHPRVISIR